MKLTFGLSSIMMQSLRYNLDNIPIFLRNFQIRTYGVDLECKILAWYHNSKIVRLCFCTLRCKRSKRSGSWSNVEGVINFGSFRWKWNEGLVANYEIDMPNNRTKIRRTKLSTFRLGVENFVQRKILSVANLVQYFNTKVKQKSDKSVEISARCRKFCPTKYFVRRNFVR